MNFDNKMKLTDILANLDKSDKNKTMADLDEFGEEFCLYSLSGYDTFNERVTGYWIRKHNCTDTWVGVIAYFLDDKFLCITQQEARKSDTYFYFASDKMMRKLHSFLLTLDEENLFGDKDIINMEKLAIDEFYQLDYSDEIIVREGFYKNEPCTVVGRTDLKSVNILLQSGEKMVVPVNSLYFRIAIS